MINKKQIQIKCIYYIKRLQQINVKREDIAFEIGRSYPMLNCQIAGKKNFFTYQDLQKLKQYYKIKKELFIKKLLTDDE